MAMITAKGGKQFDPEALPMSIAWNQDDTVDYLEVKVEGIAYRQKFTYAGGKLVAISMWYRA